MAEVQIIASPADLAMLERLRSIEEKQERAIALLEVLVAALAEGFDEEEEPPALTLDGELAGAPRDPNKALS